MEKLKVILFICFYIVAVGVMNGVDAGTLDFKYAVIHVVVAFIGLAAYLMGEKKKSAVSRKYNGQAHYVHKKTLHKNYTLKRDGVSSGF